MASIGDLVINLSANSAKLNSALKSAKKQLDIFAAATTAAATAAVAQFISVGDALNKMSIRTGVSTVDLSALAHAAKLSDTSIEAVQLSLGRMAKLLGDASNGSATAIQAFESLGLSIDKLRQMSASEQFGAIADAIKGIPNPTQKTYAAMLIFGKSAAQLIPLLNEGSAGIARMQEEARRLGLVMDDETAAAAAAASDAMTRLTGSVSMAAVRFGGMFAPALTVVINKVTDLAAKVPRLFQAFAAGAVALAVFVGAMRVVNLAMDLYAKRQVIVLALSGPKGWIALAGAAAIAGGAIAALSMEFGNYNAELARAQAQQQQFAGNPVVGPDIAGAAADFQTRMDAYIEEFRILRGETTAFEIQLEKLATAGMTPAMIENLRVMNAERERLLELQEQERQTQSKIAAEMERAAAAAEQQAAAMQSRAESIIEGLKTPMDKLIDRQAEIAMLRAANLLTEAQATLALQQAEQDFRGAEPAEFRAPQAMQQGSQEAFSAILRAMQKQDPQVAAVNQMNKNIAAKLDGVTDAIKTIQTAGVA